MTLPHEQHQPPAESPLIALLTTLNPTCHNFGAEGPVW